MIIEATYTTPFFSIDSDSGILEIEGKSIMINVSGFYEPIIEKVTDFVKNISDDFNDIAFNVKLEYFNTSSSKQIFLIFELLSTLSRKVNVNINWYYEEDDDQIYESGIDYSLMFKKINFVLIPIY